MKRPFLTTAVLAAMLLVGAGCTSKATVQTQAPNNQALDGVIEGTYSGNAAVNSN